MNNYTYDKFKSEWALVTAGSLSNHNSMTISWGGIGTLWNKDVITIYIKPIRYTHTYVESNDMFVVSFFPTEYKRALSIMGSLSGKDVDKDKEAHLTPISYKGVTIYKEAKISFICKKIYQNELDIASIPEETIKNHYLEEAPHTMYIGEIIEIVE